MNLALTAVALVVPLLLTACGDDGSDGGGNSSGSDDTAETLPPEEAEVRDALVKSFFDPSCDLLTDDYLVEKSFAADSPEEACEEHEATWIEPLYDEEDVLVSDIQVDGDVATAVVSSEGTNLTVTYELTRVDGAWLLSCDDVACDRLEAESPSAEVS